MNDKERKIYSAIIDNNVLNIMLGLDEDNANAMLSLTLSDEEIKEMAIVMAQNMAAELDGEEIDDYIDMVSRESYTKVSRVSNKAASKAIIYKAFGTVSGINDKLQENQDAYEDKKKSIKIADDGVVIYEADMDNKKLN